MNNRTKYINGIKAYFIAGCWYCDYNIYEQTKRQRGIKTNEDVFFSFCMKYDLMPTG